MNIWADGPLNKPLDRTKIANDPNALDAFGVRERCHLRGPRPHLGIFPPEATVVANLRL